MINLAKKNLFSQKGLLVMFIIISIYGVLFLSSVVIENNKGLIRNFQFEVYSYDESFYICEVFDLREGDGVQTAERIYKQKGGKIVEFNKIKDPSKLPVGFSVRNPITVRGTLLNWNFWTLRLPIEIANFMIILFYCVANVFI